MLFDRSLSRSSSDPTASNKSRKRERNYSEELWPKRRKKEEANTIFAPSEGVWNGVESIKIGDISHIYLEHEARYNLLLSQHVFELTYGDTTMFLPCRTVPDDITSSFGRAKLLYETVRVLPTLGTREYTIEKEQADKQPLIQTMREYQTHQLHHISMQEILRWFRLSLISLDETM